jgi:hypothetical protein
MTDTNSSTLLRLAQEVSSLTSQIHERLQKTTQREPSFTSDFEHAPEDTEYKALSSALTDAAQDLQILVNGPKATLRALYGNHYDLAAHQVALEYDFFGQIPLNDAIHVQTLADTNKLDVDVVERVLRLLITQRIFRELPEKRFTHSALSAAIAKDEDLQASFHMQMDEVFQAASDTASFFKNSTSPLAADNCPFQQRFGMPIFKYYEQVPAKGVRFGKALAGAAKCQLN